MTELRKVTTAVEVSSEGHRQKFTAHETGHVPYNKRRWEVHRCTAVLEVEHYDGKAAVNPEGWVNFNLTEYEDYESGRSTTRTISLTLHGNERKALIEMLGGRA